MPAKSKSQQRLFGMVHAYHKGKLKHAPASVKRIAKHVSDEDARDFAVTKHDNLPERKEKKAMDLTPFQRGFLTKCACEGVPFELATAMLKSAQTNTVAQSSFQAPDANGNITLDGSVGTVMRKGDTVSGILKRLGIPQRHLAAVLKENGLTDQSARRLRPGHVIYTRPDAYDYADTARTAAPTNPVPAVRGR